MTFVFFTIYELFRASWKRLLWREHVPHVSEVPEEAPSLRPTRHPLAFLSLTPRRGITPFGELFVQRAQSKVRVLH